MSDENNEGIVMPKVTSDKQVTEVINPEIIAESSPASEENHEQKSNGVQNRINDLTAKRYKETKRADDAEEALAILQARQPQNQPEQVQTEQVLTAPALPDDIYDEESMRKFHTDSQAFNTQMAQGAAKSQFESQQQQSKQQDLDAKHKVNLDKYAANATRDGVDFDKLLIAEQTLKQAGLGNELGSYLMNDTNGAKIVEYLHDNPAEMHEIMQLDPIAAGIRIANEIKPKALSQTPKVSGAPDPIPEVKGSGGFVEKDDFYKKYPGAVII